MSEGGERARAVGINHVALDVRDLDEAIDFLDGLFHSGHPWPSPCGQPSAVQNGVPPLEFIGASGLEKSDDARADLRKKGVEI